MRSTPTQTNTNRPAGSLPTLSVVVVHAGQRDDELLDTLATLAEPCRQSGAELLLSCATFARIPAVRRLAPACRILAIESITATPALRAAGVRAATGDVVLLIDGSSPIQELRVLERLEARRLTALPSGNRGTPPPSPPLAERPALSVIVPVYQGQGVLDGTLAALRASDLSNAKWELIVVDDASVDESVYVASRYADVLVRIPLRPHGPAYARNRGFDVSLGECAVFVDADVRLHPDALGRFARAFAEDRSASAIVGCYDAEAPAPGLVSQYRNLLHHYMHRESSGDTETFWAPCGAVRRQAFIEAGMFNEWHFFRPTIEDVEIGQRMRALGHRIVVRPEIQGKHVKQWTLLSAVTCDLRDRSLPWMRLILGQRRGHSAGISLRAIERINVGGTWIALVCLLIGSVVGDPRWVMTMGIALLPLVFANRRLYAFLERQRGFLFTLAVIPLHLLYYVLLGAAIIMAWLLRAVVGDPRPEPLVEAFAEVGGDTWPPVPSKRHTLGDMQPSAARV